jgi:glutamate/tyrosine decarboxylase-like PLP-dependent enzyme
MTLSVYGADRIGAIVQQSCDLAGLLAARVDREPALERLAPVALNIVCFRFTAAEGNLDRLNADIVADLQEGGIAAPSTTMVNGVLAIRAAIVNHRTAPVDLDILVDTVLEAGHRRATTNVAASARRPAPQ